MLRVLLHIHDRNLVRAPEAFQFVAVHNSRGRPPFRRAQNNHGPPRALGHAAGARFPLNSSDFRDAKLRRRGHGLMHAPVLRAFDEVGRPAVSSHQTLQFLVADPRQHRGIVDLVAIQMKDRQDRAIANGAKKLIDVP